ncbi:MAG: alpha-amylase family glycosyl hydrolase [bacterium]
MKQRLFFVKRDEADSASSVELEFHVSRAAREKYEFDRHLFSTRGNVIFTSFHAARLFAQKMNRKRDLLNRPQMMVRAGEINAMGLLHEVFHWVVHLYRQQVNPKVFDHAVEWLHNKVGAESVEPTLITFAHLFPTSRVYEQGIDAATYLRDDTGGVTNRLIVLEELMLLSVSNANSALAPFRELFDDKMLRNQTGYTQMLQGMSEFFKTQPTFGPDDLDLLSLLRQPAAARPHSLSEQLRFIFTHWGPLVEKFRGRLLASLDLIKEESKTVFPGQPPTEVARYEVEDEAERFSEDLDWMPKLVLIAKSTLVWLDQLSKKYHRPITRLDQIPDAELDTLAGWGFTGLWLIGIWQRCEASKTIKRISGNPEAEASAYSLYDYEISHELGGTDALQNLKARCWRRGIRLACDMVPNHTGIDSRWLREHPDWYISLPYSPFPAYTFNGVNLSADPRYVVQIEDRYHDQSDAAVVFKRQDTWSGDVRYIYHGNDGTNMPWNDTAQLNYLHPQVREAMLQKIVEVARLFPIIRFDAAMTLTKKHYQRLWFPEPGSGGDIPSRAECGMTKQEFNGAMPQEFWRQVVDRVAQEVPDCLLLAEAFWLMEGYFVRTLGMHRVYNSAFMNMLKNEENQKYRKTVINTLQFNPEILKRFVNFMNNPDEETAIAQFGDGDKYFGVCLMMVTMPGLPMFGHGQTEGLHEKYGMEYRRAYWDEPGNHDLVERHQREIFPLMKKRYLFAGVENFLFYDFVTPNGFVNENMFVYSNRRDGERVVVIYNNKYEHASGWIRASVPYAEKSENGIDNRLVQKSLRQGLQLPYDDNTYLIFTDAISGLQYIRNCKQICDQGLYFELGAFKYQLLTDMVEIRDNQWRHYAQLTHHLNGRGVASISEALQELALNPLLERVDAVLNHDMLQAFMSSRLSGEKAKIDSTFIDKFVSAYRQLLPVVKKFVAEACTGNLDALAKELGAETEAALCLLSSSQRLPRMKPEKRSEIVNFVQSSLTDDIWRFFFGWLTVHGLGQVRSAGNYEAQSAAWLEEWLLGKRVVGLLRAHGMADERAARESLLLSILTEQQNWSLPKGRNKPTAYSVMRDLLSRGSVQQFLRMNRFDDILWFNKERFEELVRRLFLVAAVKIGARSLLEGRSATQRVANAYGIARKWLEAMEASGYQVERLLLFLEKE